VKVQKTSEQGREIILYRVEKGESCIMTTSCLISNKEYNAEGIAESDIELAVIPHQAFNLLLGSSELFRKFTFEVYAERVAILMMLIEEVVFKKLDERLAKLLIDKDQPEISATHQELATELGSVREVVSRQMKIFERSAMIELKRGKIKILNKTALQNYSNE
jgi:CRP/FNR family transcriptional regulator